MTSSDYIGWQEGFSVGSVALDSQHRIMLGFLNDLYQAAQAGESRALLRELFDTACRYAERHFAAEEELLECAGYPRLAAHKAEHGEYRKCVEQLSATLYSAPDASLDELFQYLKIWWTAHLGGADRDYLPFVREAL